VLTLGGKPLIAHVLGMLTAGFDARKVVVMTDDDEIAGVAAAHGTTILREPRTTGTRTLDEVAVDVCRHLTANGAYSQDILVTVQPTCPFITAKTIRAAAELLLKGSRTVLTVSDDRHLRWTRDAEGRPQPMYQERLNRQVLPPVLRETGGVIAGFIGDILTTGTRIQKGRVMLVEVDEKEAIDIDTYTDFLVAQHYLTQRKVLIRADGSKELGVGHINRAIALATNLPGYDIEIVTRCDGEYALGHHMLAEQPFRLHTIAAEAEFSASVESIRPDILFLDILNTQAGDIQGLRNFTSKIVSFEDLGEGAQHVDLVINDLYASHSPARNELSGVENALLSTVFEHLPPRPPLNDTVENVLVLFGGTDPSALTGTALSALGTIGYAGKVTVVAGPGQAGRQIDLAAFGLKGEVLRNVTDMAQVMAHADLAISSAGRTVTELMTVGVPTVVLCQNRREMLHTHASQSFGVMNLGLGKSIDPETLGRTLKLLQEDRGLRAHMRTLMLSATAKRSNREIVRRIEHILGLERPW
jgi:spore coat polysaccharide biosynthesis predicted glycosyltransferase SpsG/CMP-N-acetylneuraminic acid synthetase